MKRNHSAEEIAQCLAKADGLLEEGVKVVDVARILGVSRMTYYRWRRDQAGTPADADLRRRLMRLEEENAALRRQLAQLTAGGTDAQSVGGFSFA
ncbi:transposase [Nitrospirillum sp. BR 11163]|uniref:transposase n=1 Tax=Nitrospirillum sp. BR 11163 TaxID=3104323 RepID=UPI002AFF9D7B|nr:transposase [Nitrospirillum sp. BR 11163]MEA1675493.1 transposase [Nitrospirillum sp. BR 11163]